MRAFSFRKIFSHPLSYGIAWAVCSLVSALMLLSKDADLSVTVLRSVAGFLLTCWLLLAVSSPAFVAWTRERWKNPLHPMTGMQHAAVVVLVIIVFLQLPALLTNSMIYGIAILLLGPVGALISGIVLISVVQAIRAFFHLLRVTGLMPPSRRHVRFQEKLFAAQAASEPEAVALHSVQETVSETGSEVAQPASSLLKTQVFSVDLPQEALVNSSFPPVSSSQVSSSLNDSSSRSSLGADQASGEAKG